MDPKTPTPTSASDQPSDGLIMPEPQVIPAPAPATEPVVSVGPVSVPVAVTAAPVEAAVQLPVEEPVVADVAPAPAPVPELAPIPELESDPLFDPVTEPDPLDVVPEPVAPTPASPVTDQTMNQLDDGAQPVVAVTGQTVVASSEPHKSRRKTMIILVVGLLLAGAAGFGAYTLFAKPNVSETTTPSAILAVDQLSPESLTQATDKGEIKAGSQTNANILIFTGTAPTDAPPGLSLQIEIQPLGTDFTGTPLADTVAVADETNLLKVTVSDYAVGSYHWRGRLTDGTSNGPWVAFNTDQDAGKTADFTIDQTAPAAALIKTINGKAVAAKAVTSTVAQPVITGTAEVGSTITAAFNETLSYRAAASADGTWTLTPSAPLANGKYTLVVTSTDGAGNATATTYTFTQAAK